VFDLNAIDGTTWWWGYQNASQVRGDFLVFTAQGTSTAASSFQQRESLDPDFEAEGGLGPVLELAVDWQFSEEWLAGIDFTFSWLGIDVADRGRLAFASQQSSTFRISETDTFALGGIVPPPAPYSGTEAGPGPVIDNNPARTRQEALVRRREAFLDSVADASFSADVCNFSLGPSVTWKHGRLSIRGTAGLELDVVAWDLSTTETVIVSRPSGSRQLARWKDSSSATTLVPGVGLGASVTWDLTPSLDLTAFARFRAMENAPAGSRARRMPNGGCDADSGCEPS
jgi:hypothetical protein